MAAIVVAHCLVVSPTTLVRLAGILGGLCWIGRALLDDGNGPDLRDRRACTTAGWPCSSSPCSASAAGLVSGLVALRVVVAVCLVALAAAVVSFLHQQYSDRSVDGILGGLMVVYCVVGILARRGREPTTPGAAPPPRRTGSHAGLDSAGRRAGHLGNERGHAAGCGRGGERPHSDGCRRCAMDGLQRLAMISLHTSPLDQPGTGDAGGMNVYVIELAKRLARRGVEVDIFTRATSSALDQVVEACDGVTVRHIHAGPFEGLTKNELPAQLCVFAREVLRTEAAHPVGHYDIVHSHYWLSGQVGRAGPRSLGRPARALDAHDGQGQERRPRRRRHPRAAGPGDRRGAGRRGRRHAHRQHRPRGQAAHRALRRRSRPASRWSTRASTSTSSGRCAKDAARAGLGLPVDADVLLFAGRIQPLKAPDVLLRAVAALLEREPGRRSRTVVPIVGGPSGSGLDKPQALADLAAELGLGDVVRFVPPVSQAELAQWYAAATLVAVPSYNESFGLVAVEAEATGTPVVAAAVGGLTTAVRDGRSGLLVPGHRTDDWADALQRILTDDTLRATLEAGARDQASLFSWEATAEATLRVYERARSSLTSSV